MEKFKKKLNKSYKRDTMHLNLFMKNERKNGTKASADTNNVKADDNINGCKWSSLANHLDQLTEKW